MNMFHRIYDGVRVVFDMHYGEKEYLPSIVCNAADRARNTVERILGEKVVAKYISH